MGLLILIFIGLLIKFQDGNGAMISTGVAQSICGQAMKFAQTQTVQPPQRQKRTSSSIPCGWFRFRKCHPGKWNRYTMNVTRNETIKCRQTSQVFKLMESCKLMKKLNLLRHPCFLIDLLKVERPPPARHSHSQHLSTVTRQKDQVDQEREVWDNPPPGLWVEQRRSLMRIHLSWPYNKFDLTEAQLTIAPHSSSTRVGWVLSYRDWFLMKKRLWRFFASPVVWRMSREFHCWGMF